ncbi:hypothetical protein M2139_000019 [Enterococcus sp. PF1-24]|uniref:FxLYD domain-containing protein n=1 Tax=unclassified Enterococcus TaxID=2608891 RepID=UPI0024762F93|nr:MULTISPECIES: FxLYD domain-containing protein [unclassified Enterococcus]MDH6363044.1 hypothetical protein [Enterococcus sp. PFB1-1]MDH6400138.1 hypothetical protein [Enterococcus sp. PF1-24]
MNKLKKFGFALLTLLFVMSGCTSGKATTETTESTGPNYADSRFLKSIAKGLETRWDYVASGYTDNEKESLRKATQMELDELAAFKDEKFEDSKLQEKALSYINELTSGIETISNYGADSFNDEWNQHYANRTELLLDITDNYSVVLDEKYQSTLEDLRAKGNEVKKDITFNKELEALLASVVFNYVPKEYDDTWKNYEAVVENTTSKDIMNFSASVSIFDADNVIIGTQYINAANWTKGQKVKFEFMFDKDIARYEIVNPNVY